jgi:hypothetical protein
MSDGSMEIDFDQERTFFKSHCLEYSTVDIFQMMFGIALESRSVIAANVSGSKNKKSQDLSTICTITTFSPTTRSPPIRAAYGYNTSVCLKYNLDNIDARMLQ